MSSIVDLLESLDRIPWLFWLLLLGFICGASYFFYKAYSGRRFSLNESTDSKGLDTLENNTSWRAHRDYKTVIQNGPIGHGDYTGWFEDEIKICEHYKSKLDQLGKDVDIYPTVAGKYLHIVGEQSRKIKPYWVWVLLIILMVIESYGLSVLLAQIYTDTGTTAQENLLANGLVIIIGVILLGAASWVGPDLYKQIYARNIWVDSNNSIRRIINDDVEIAADPELSEAGNSSDSNQPQAIRKANRSTFVGKVKSDAVAGANEGYKVSKFNRTFKWYVAGVLIFGLVMVAVRYKSIDEKFSSDIKMLAETQKVDELPKVSNNTSKNPPREAAGGAQVSNDLLTQDILEKNKQTKILGMLVYLLIYLATQVLALATSYSFGFASDKGSEAYKLLKAFRKRHGLISEADYSAAIGSKNVFKTKDIKATAQKFLKDWQLGLQTFYRSNANNLIQSQLEMIEKSLQGADKRTFIKYQALDSAQNKQVQSTPEETNPVPQPHPVNNVIMVDYYTLATNGNEEVCIDSLDD